LPGACPASTYRRSRCSFARCVLTLPRIHIPKFNRPPALCPFLPAFERVFGDTGVARVAPPVR
jgi:hypothetical protein